MKKSCLIVFCLVFVLQIGFNKGFAADFILPNSGGDPVTVDISSLNTTQDIDVSIGDFTDQARPYRDSNTSQLLIFPPASLTSEKTLTVRAGGSSITKTISYRPVPGGDIQLSALSDANRSKGLAASVKLSDGRILVVGGSMNLVGAAINTLEIFDPNTGLSTLAKTPNSNSTARLKTARSAHTVTHLGINNSPIGSISGPVEQILVVGGFSSGGKLLRTIEIIEVKVGTNDVVSTQFSGKNARLKKARSYHTASLLLDGRVLIVGGQGKINSTTIGALNSVEIFNPITRKIEASTFTLKTSRLLHTATALQDGKILISGGFTNEEQNRFGVGPGVRTGELIDPGNLTIKDVGDLIDEVGLGGHSATLLPNGAVIIIGGSTDFFSNRTGESSKGLTSSALQFYDPSTESFVAVKSESNDVNLALQTSRFLHRSVLLPNGTIVIIGGLNVKEGTSSSSIVNTPVRSIEAINLNLLSTTTSLTGSFKSLTESLHGRVAPVATLITPKEKTKGFLSSSDSNQFLNAAILISGGFEGGSGTLPTKSTEIIQVSTSSSVDGRKLVRTPNAIYTGGNINNLTVQFDDFTKVNSIEATPQTLNLSSANEFMASLVVGTTNNESILLKAEGSSSVVISPSLFQSGDTLSISRSSESVTGQFNIDIVPVNSDDDFISANVTVNVSGSSSPFLSTTPSSGVSLSDDGSTNSQTITVKVLTDDGSSELNSIPENTMLTATVSNSSVANLGDTGVSSITGTLATNFILNAVSPGSATVTFNLDFPNVLPVTIPIEVSGLPRFTDSPIDSVSLTNLEISGVEFSSFSSSEDQQLTFTDVSLSPERNIFPIYVPVNVVSSNSLVQTSELFSLNPVYSVDDFTGNPRTFINDSSSNFIMVAMSSVSDVSGFISDSSQDLIALASMTGVRINNLETTISENLSKSLNRIGKNVAVRRVKFFEVNGQPKVAAISGERLLVINAASGEQESSTRLSGKGFELLTTEISGQKAAIVSTGKEGFDLVFPLEDLEPRLINVQLSGTTSVIDVLDRFNGEDGPFVIAYDGVDTFSIVDLEELPSPISSTKIDTKKVKNISYAGKYKINDSDIDVLVASAGRKLILIDLTNGRELTITKRLNNIRSTIRDLLVKDGIAYLALGNKGVLSIRISSLIDPSENISDAIVNEFRESTLIVNRSNGVEQLRTQNIQANTLDASGEFIFCTGANTEVAVIKVIP